MKKTAFLLLALPIVVSLLLTGSGTAGDQSAAPLGEAQARMAEALKNADATALALCYTEDARLSFPLRPDITGRDEIRRQMEYVIGLGMRSFHIIEEDLFAGEDWVLQGGTCIFYNQTGQEFSRARFMTVWRRVDGRWLIHRDMVC